ncbi:hypothetical protein HG537_0B01760 [Torulaspora globosa]|uniref:RING-type domain-containing protein n=1 Tax=Torulaspora globosa TaxID=48254 RepID=A0A7H9HM08_9SACH|nr:hypothetical protein HG537_0B01760 [Torulaspora sp. CBS 2947]
MAELLQSVCSICLTEIDGEFGELSPCKHKFHQECIRHWHSCAPDLRCPACRVESDSFIVAGRHKIDLTTGFKVKTLVDAQQSGLLDRLNRTGVDST